MLKRFSTRQIPPRTAGQGATEENTHTASEGGTNQSGGRKSMRQENEQSKFHELLLFMDTENDQGKRS
jgi:hypothetical protein